MPVRSTAVSRFPGGRGRSGQRLICALDHACRKRHAGNSSHRALLDGLGGWPAHGRVQPYPLSSAAPSLPQRQTSWICFGHVASADLRPLTTIRRCHDSAGAPRHSVTRGAHFIIYVKYPVRFSFLTALFSLVAHIIFHLLMASKLGLSGHMGKGAPIGRISHFGG